MATATEAKPAAEYAPLTRAGHNAETVLEVEGLQTYLFTITAHKITDPYQAERIIAGGSADMAGMVRALIADPEFPRKAGT